MEATIKLDSLFEEQKTLEDSIARAETILSGKKLALSEFNEKAKEDVIQQLRCGQTTGNPLTDEIITVFGLDRPTIDKILAFNERLVKGKELLLVAPYQHRVRFGKSLSEDDFMDETGYVLGTLSGKRMELKMKEGLSSHGGYSVIMPFERHVVWGFKHGNMEIVPVAGSLTISEYQIRHLDPHKLLSSIPEKTNRDLGGTMMLAHFDQEEPLEIIIDGEIPSGTSAIDQAKIEMALEDGRKKIGQATPSEQIAGKNI